MNCYATLTQIKADLGILGTTDDARLLADLKAASRHIDNFCNRHFFVKTEARHYDGKPSPLLIDDLLSIVHFKLDNDRDLTHEDILAATDYELYPLNEYPKIMAKISADSDYAEFAKGIVAGVEISGDWGYGNGLSATPYRASGATVTVADGSATTVVASAGTSFEVGQTILADTEQMFIEAIATNNLTVKREVNGTTGAAHLTAMAYIYEYPDDVIQACIMVTARLFESRGKVFESERLGDYSYKAAGVNVTVSEQSLLMAYKKVTAC